MFPDESTIPPSPEPDVREEGKPLENRTPLNISPIERPLKPVAIYKPTEESNQDPAEKTSKASFTNTNLAIKSLNSVESNSNIGRLPFSTTRYSAFQPISHSTTAQPNSCSTTPTFSLETSLPQNYSTPQSLDFSTISKVSALPTVPLMTPTKYDSTSQKVQSKSSMSSVLTSSVKSTSSTLLIAQTIPEVQSSMTVESTCKKQITPSIARSTSEIPDQSSQSDQTPTKRTQYGNLTPSASASVENMRSSTLTLPLEPQMASDQRTTKNLAILSRNEAKVVRFSGQLETSLDQAMLQISLTESDVLPKVTSDHTSLTQSEMSSQEAIKRTMILEESINQNSLAHDTNPSETEAHQTLEKSKQPINSNDCEQTKQHMDRMQSNYLPKLSGAENVIMSSEYAYPNTHNKPLHNFAFYLNETRTGTVSEKSELLSENVLPQKFTLSESTSTQTDSNQLEASSEQAGKRQEIQPTTFKISRMTSDNEIQRKPLEHSKNIEDSHSKPTGLQMEYSERDREIQHKPKYESLKRENLQSSAEQTTHLALSDPTHSKQPPSSVANMSSKQILKPSILSSVLSSEPIQHSSVKKSQQEHGMKITMPLGQLHTNMLTVPVTFNTNEQQNQLMQRVNSAFNTQSATMLSQHISSTAQSLKLSEQTTIAKTSTQRTPLVYTLPSKTTTMTTNSLVQRLPFAEYPHGMQLESNKPIADTTTIQSERQTMHYSTPSTSIGPTDYTLLEPKGSKVSTQKNIDNHTSPIFTSVTSPTTKPPTSTQGFSLEYSPKPVFQIPQSSSVPIMAVFQPMLSKSTLLPESSLTLRPPPLPPESVLLRTSLNQFMQPTNPFHTLPKSQMIRMPIDSQYTPLLPPSAHKSSQQVVVMQPTTTSTIIGDIHTTPCESSQQPMTHPMLQLLLPESQQKQLIYTTTSMSNIATEVTTIPHLPLMQSMPHLSAMLSEPPMAFQQAYLGQSIPRTSVQNILPDPIEDPTLITPKAPISELVIESTTTSIQRPEMLQETFNMSSDMSSQASRSLMQQGQATACVPEITSKNYMAYTKAYPVMSLEQQKQQIEGMFPYLTQRSSEPLTSMVNQISSSMLFLAQGQSREQISTKIVEPFDTLRSVYPVTSNHLMQGTHLVQPASASMEQLKTLGQSISYSLVTTSPSHLPNQLPTTQIDVNPTQETFISMPRASEGIEASTSTAASARPPLHKDVINTQHEAALIKGNDPLTKVSEVLPTSQIIEMQNQTSDDVVDISFHRPYIGTTPLQTAIVNPEDVDLEPPNSNNLTTLITAAEANKIKEEQPKKPESRFHSITTQTNLSEGTVRDSKNKVVFIQNKLTTNKKLLFTIQNQNPKLLLQRTVLDPKHVQRIDDSIIVAENPTPKVVALKRLHQHNYDEDDFENLITENQIYGNKIVVKEKFRGTSQEQERLIKNKKLNAQSEINNVKKPVVYFGNIKFPANLMMIKNNSASEINNESKVPTRSSEASESLKRTDYTFINKQNVSTSTNTKLFISNKLSNQNLTMEPILFKQVPATANAQFTGDEKTLHLQTSHQKLNKEGQRDITQNESVDNAHTFSFKQTSVEYDTRQCTTQLEEVSSLDLYEKQRKLLRPRHQLSRDAKTDVQKVEPKKPSVNGRNIITPEKMKAEIYKEFASVRLNLGNEDSDTESDYGEDEFQYYESIIKTYGKEDVSDIKAKEDFLTNFMLGTHDVCKEMLWNKKERGINCDSIASAYVEAGRLDRLINEEVSREEMSEEPSLVNFQNTAYEDPNENVVDFEKKQKFLSKFNLKQVTPQEKEENEYTWQEILKERIRRDGKETSDHVFKRPKVYNEKLKEKKEINTKSELQILKEIKNCVIQNNDLIKKRLDHSCQNGGESIKILAEKNFSELDRLSRMADRSVKQFSGQETRKRDLNPGFDSENIQTATKPDASRGRQIPYLNLNIPSIPKIISLRSSLEPSTVTTTQATSMDEPKNSAACAREVTPENKIRDVTCQTENPVWPGVEIMVKMFREFEKARKKEIVELTRRNTSLKVEGAHITRRASRDSDQARALLAERRNLALEEAAVKQSIQRIFNAVDVIRNYF